MVNDASRRSHVILRTSWEVNQNGLGCIASERLSFTRLGKAFRGKPRSKPESGNPTFRDCRGARGNVTFVSYHMVRAPRLYPDPGQSRAGRPVASVVIHRVTGGCEAYTARKQAVKIQLRGCEADAVDEAEGSIGTTDKARSHRLAGVPSSGHASKGISQKPRRALHLLLTMGGTGFHGRVAFPERRV